MERGQDYLIVVGRRYDHGVGTAELRPVELQVPVVPGLKYQMTSGSYIGVRYNGFTKTITLIPGLKESVIKRKKNSKYALYIINGVVDLRSMVPGRYLFIGGDRYRLKSDGEDDEEVV